MLSSWVTVAVATAFLVDYFVPSYLIMQSLIGTISGFVVLSIILRVLYLCTLYPVYFSPIRHIPTPKVSSPSVGIETGNLTGRMSTEEIITEREFKVYWPGL
jgi:hypothetical protein